MILRLACATTLCFSLLACGGSQKPKTDPDTELNQLITLYEQNRAKFVVQKQNLVQDADCSRATGLREAADRKAEAAAMSPDDTGTITKVQMEMQQAEKDCLAK